MEWRMWLRLLLMIQIVQDLLDSGVYSMRSTLSCEEPNHYPYMHSKGDWRCCLKCPAGKRVQSHCTANNPNTTQCVLCTMGQYQPKSNGNLFCKQCTNQQHKANRVLVSNCTSTHNREYGPCENGYYYNTVLDFCERCRSCPAGFGVEEECSGTRNTKCSLRKCTVGKYSDQNSHIQRCENCKPCGVNEEMFRECTATTNYGCRVRRVATTPTKDVHTGDVRVTSLVHVWATSSNGVKAGSSSSSRSWVMPFFVSAMALLLFMFIVFVIGVTIWCHRHSRKKQEREERSVETPMIENPKTKCHEQTRTTLVSKEKSDRYHIVNIPKKIRENDMKLREVSHDIIEELATYLNPANTNNWKKVATKLGFSWDVIKNLELNPTRATQTLLGSWGTKKDATVFTLYSVLKEIDRDDAADGLERLLIGSCPNVLRSV